MVKPKLVELYRGRRNPITLSSYVDQEMSAFMMMRRSDVEQRCIYQKRLADRNAVNSLNINAGDFSGRISLGLWYPYRNTNTCADEEVSTYELSLQ